MITTQHGFFIFYLHILFDFLVTTDIPWVSATSSSMFFVLRFSFTLYGGCDIGFVNYLVFPLVDWTSWDWPRSSEQLEWKAFSFFSISKQSDASRYGSNIIFTSTKKKQICQVWRAWLKKCPCHALEKFLMVKGMAASFFRLCLSNLVKSWNLMSTDTGENLVLISQTTFE